MKFHKYSNLENVDTSLLDAGDVVMIRKGSSPYYWEQYKFTSDGELAFVRGITDEQYNRLEQITQSLIDKLEDSYTKEQIDDIEDSLRSLIVSTTAGLPETFPNSGDTLTATDIGQWTILTEGTYNQVGHPSIVVGEGKVVFAQFDGTQFSIQREVEMPAVEGTDTLEEELIPKGKAIINYLDGLVIGNTSNLDTVLSAGTFNATTGALNTSVNWIRTEYVNCQPETEYIAEGFGQTNNDANNQRVAFYTSDNSFISYLPSPSVGSTFTFTTPTDCAKLVFVVDSGPNVGADVPNSPYQNTFSIRANIGQEPQLFAEKIKGNIETEQLQVIENAVIYENNEFKKQFDFTKDVTVLPYKKIGLPAPSGVNHLNFAVTKESDVSVISAKIDSIATGVNAATDGSIRLGFGDKDAAIQFVKRRSSNTGIDAYFMSRFGVNELSPAISIASTELSVGDKITLFRSGLGVYFYLNNQFLGFKDLKNQGELSGHLGGVIGFRDNLATWVASDVQYEKRNSPYMHLSVDDCITSFQWIKENSPASIFEDARFSVYKELNEKYGACISLYLFYQNSSNTFDLSQMPASYRQEFIDNSNWLKLGFHGVDSTTSYTTIDTPTGVEHYNRIVDEIYRFAGYSSIDNMPRFSMFTGNNELFEELKSCGLVGVLTADDTRTDNSGLLANERTALGVCDDYYSYERELYYVKSEGRLDTTTDVQVIQQLNALHQNANNNNVYEMFWHQNRELNPEGKEMLEAMCQWALSKGIRFDFPQNNIFK